jgi:predicted ATPase
VLLIVTGRPEFQPPWRDAAYAATIELRPIAGAAAEALVKRIPGAGQLTDTAVRGIAARAEGVPLFIEELTRATLDGGMLNAAPETRSAGAPAIPAGLQASLMARLDRLGATREVARIAAALGRSFPFDLLSAVMPDRDPAALRRELQRLVNAELIAPVPSLSTESYAFRHGLIQDAAYGTLLSGARCTAGSPRRCRTGFPRLSPPSPRS